MYYIRRKDQQRHVAESIAEPDYPLLEEAVRELEADEAGLGNDNGVGKKVTKGRSATDKADLQALKRIREFGLGTIVVNGRTVCDFSPHNTTPSRRIKELFPPKNASANDNALPHWKYTGDRLKYAMALQSLAGRGYAFSLNFGPERLADALASSLGFSRYVSRCLDRAFERHLGYVPEYCFAIDVTARGKLHIHGGLGCSCQSEEPVRAALLGAGGEGYEAARPGEKQEHLVLLRTPAIWTNYNFRQRANVRKRIDGPTFAINQALRRSAKAVYEAVKREVDRA